MALVLLVEDDKSVREFVTRALREDGYSVTSVDNGMKALDAIDTAEFDLLLADIRMPEMDGISLALKVSKDRPDLPILLMTGYTTDQQRAHNLDSLILEVIEKPFTLRQIRDAAKKAILASPK